MDGEGDVIVTERLAKRYGHRVGVDGVSLRIGRGQLFGFLGPNGSGKSTTIRLLLGLLRPTAGAARVMGRDCWREGHILRRDVGYLPGDLRLYSWLSLSVALRMFGAIRRRDLSQEGRRLAERFELEADLPAQRMSRGTRQKLGLVLALAHRPQLLVLDEPTSGLDPIMQRKLAEVLREMASEGHTIFFSSHTLREVEQLCDRVAIVRRGRIVADETLDELRRRARRSVSIVFDGAESASQGLAPEFLSRVAREGAVWKAELAGPAGELVRWAAGRPVVDVSIGEPDLEEVFHRFYESRESDSPESESDSREKDSRKQTEQRPGKAPVGESEDKPDGWLDAEGRA